MTAPKLETDPARSALMRRVRQRRTEPEDVVAYALRQVGIRYRRNVRSLPGSPDFANKRRKWAIFVNGCFWHHHTNCTRGTLPKRNAGFWREKFALNRDRDARKVKLLRRDGYKVLIVWECEIKQIDQLYERLREYFAT